MDTLSLILNVLIGLVGFVAFRVFLEKFIAGRQDKRRHEQKMMTLQIRVAKDNETGPIVAEQMFSTVHSIAKHFSFWDRLSGKSQDQVSFEIANVDRNIKFYVHFPERLRNLVEGQIYAQYANAEIIDVPDYSAARSTEVLIPKDKDTAEGRESKALVPVNALSRKEAKDSVVIKDFQNAVGVELGLGEPDVFPIKRYPQFEDKKSKVALDPLAAITSTLSKFNHPDEQAWIQLVVRPLEDKWRLVFTKCIRMLSKGMYMHIESLQKMHARAYITRNRITRIIFFPVYWLFALQSFKGGGVNLEHPVHSESEIEEQTSRTHDKETSTIAAIDKVGKLMYEVTARIVYIPKTPDKEVAMAKLREIAGSFKQFNIPHLNGFEIEETLHGEEAIESYHRRDMKKSFVLNVEELATIWHLPNTTVTTPNIYWVRSKRVEPPIDLPLPGSVPEEDLTILGRTNFRSSNQTFGIKTLDRRRHIYIIGKTGMGKSTLLENMIFSDIQAGRGLAVVDPHGDLADAVLNFVPARRTNDVVLFDPSDRDFPVAFNMLENIDPSLNTIVCSGLVGIFKKIYAESWGPRLEHILRNTILSLLEYPNTTMLGIPRILQDKDFRARVIRKISDPIVKSFWVNEFEKMDPKNRVEAISPILNKVGQFLSSPIIRNILGQPQSAIDLRFAMDHKKIVIVNLSKGKIGEDTSSLLGSMMITKFQLDAMSRANIPEKDRTDFYLYVDEFQNFATDSFATILSEARKYKLNLTMANQYIAQMPEEVRDAVFGNVGSILSFQVGFDDAEYLSSQYGEEVLPPDLVSLNKYTAYTRLLVDGMPTKTFSLDTLAPPQFEPEEGRREKVIRMSRERYASRREVVEDKIRRWHENATQEELPMAARGELESAPKKSELPAPDMTTKPDVDKKPAAVQKAELPKTVIVTKPAPQKLAPVQQKPQHKNPPPKPHK